jgi:hypothetical protein
MWKTLTLLLLAAGSLGIGLALAAGWLLLRHDGGGVRRLFCQLLVELRLGDDASKKKNSR